MILHEKEITPLLAFLFLLLLVTFMWAPVFSVSRGLLGHLIGILGTLIVAYNLVYSFRKRIRGRKGPDNPIRYHIYAGLLGSSLILLHAHHMNFSWNGTLTFLAIVTIVLSGLAGRYLLGKISVSVRNQKKYLADMRADLHLKRSKIDRSACTTILALYGSSERSDVESIYDPVISSRCDEIVDLARAIMETEYTLQGFAKTKSLFDKWLRVHVYLAAFLFAMILVHVMSKLYYGLGWLP